MQCNILNATFKHALNLERHLHVLFTLHLYRFRICFPFTLLVFLTSGERFRRVKFMAGVDSCVEEMMGDFPADLIVYRVSWDKWCHVTPKPDVVACIPLACICCLLSQLS